MYGNADGWGAISTHLLGGKRRYTHTAVSREIVSGGVRSPFKIDTILILITTLLIRVDMSLYRVC